MFNIFKRLKELEDIVNKQFRKYSIDELYSIAKENKFRIFNSINYLSGVMAMVCDSGNEICSFRLNSYKEIDKGIEKIHEYVKMKNNIIKNNDGKMTKEVKTFSTLKNMSVPGAIIKWKDRTGDEFCDTVTGVSGTGIDILHSQISKKHFDKHKECGGKVYLIIP